LLPDLAGHGQGHFTVRGAAAEPDIMLELQAGDLRFQEYALATTGLHLDLRRLGLEQSRLSWNIHELQLGEQQLSEVRAELEGDRARHALRFSADGTDFGGQLLLRGGLDGQFDWAGQLLSATLDLPPKQQWTLADTVALRWRQAQRQLTVTAHCWRQRDSSLCLTEDASLGEQGSVHVALASFHLEWLSPWMPQGLQWQAPLDAGLVASWQGSAPPTVKAEINSRRGLIVLEQEDSDPLELAYERIGVTVSLEQNGLDAALELASERLGAGRLTAQTRLGPEAVKPLSGEVALDGLQLGLLGAFLPDIQRLEGVVSVNGRLGGSLQDPQFRGNVRLADGEVMSAQLPMSLTDIQLQAEVSGSEARLQGSFDSGKGSARLDGSASWSGEAWRLDLGLKGERLRVVYEPLAELEVSPDLHVTVQPQQVLVEGRVLIPKGKITLKELPEGAVDMSEDVIVVRRKEPLAAEEDVPAANWRITLDIELALGNSVQIDGFGLTGRLAGDLRMRQRPNGVPEAAGELRIVDGRYKAYGQDLEIRQGQLLFSGPLTQPSLNVEAVRRVDMVVAGLRIEGEPEAPQVTLFPGPGLPQEELLSYLVRGRPLGAEGAGGDQLLAQAALSLGIFGGKGFASSLASELGVEEFEVGTAGEGEETQVELSGYLTPDLLVRYGIGVFEPINTLTLRYRINKNFFVEAVSGLESALDFFYQFEF
jgi:translocation and assembly module TamB